MTPQTLAAIASVILSLLFSYVPGFKNWYEPKPATIKRLVMLALVSLTAMGAFGLTCAGWGDQLNLNLTCDPEGVLGLIQTLIAAIAANQTAYLISPQPDRKKSSDYRRIASAKQEWEDDQEAFEYERPRVQPPMPHKVASIKKADK